MAVLLLGVFFLSLGVGLGGVTPTRQARLSALLIAAKYEHNIAREVESGD